MVLGGGAMRVEDLIGEVLYGAMRDAAQAFSALGRSMREMESQAMIADRGLLPELIERRKTDPDICYLDVAEDREVRGVNLRPADHLTWPMGGHTAFVYEHYVKPDGGFKLSVLAASASTGLSNERLEDECCESPYPQDDDAARAENE